MSRQVLVLGAGFGGLELSTMMSEESGGEIEVTLIDKGDSFVLETRFPGVYAVGDVATAGVPKAGVFAEGAARVVAQTLIAKFAGGEEPGRHLGRGTCYIEFGSGRVGSVDIDFLSGPFADWQLQRSFGGAARREGTVRLHAPGALVRSAALTERFAPYTWVNRPLDLAGII
jgi:NADH dehydrogenase FAD-containing subunit